MRPLRPLVFLGLVCMLTVAAPATAQPAPVFPVLVEIRAAHHPGFDRLVFEFEGALPRQTRAHWVDRVVHDGSGRPVAVQGRAFLSVVFVGAVGHADAPALQTTYGPHARAFDLPNIAHVVEAGDFEATLSFGVGLMRRTSILRKVRLEDPSRYVIDVSTEFLQRRVPVALLDQDPAPAEMSPPSLHTVQRTVPAGHRAGSALLRLWAGPTAAERADGLRVRRSGTTGFRDLTIRDGVARLTLRGRCDGDGEALTIADEVIATLKPFERVRWVKILDRAGRTQHPNGRRDSVPDCLAP